MPLRPARSPFDFPQGERMVGHNKRLLLENEGLCGRLEQAGQGAGDQVAGKGDLVAVVMEGLGVGHGKGPGLVR